MSNTKYEIPHKLELAIKKDQLVIFIGAGISRISSLPSWFEIVKKTLSDPAIRKGSSYIAAMEDEIITPLEALDKIKKDNIREVYKHFEKETSTLIKNDIYNTIQTITKKNNHNKLRLSNRA